jgi:hypothetical protein
MGPTTGLTDQMLDLLINHWKALAALWFIICAVNYMPTPGSGGWTSNFLYKWAFGTTHAFVGLIPRIIMALWPQYAKFLPGNGKGEGEKK